MITEILKIHSLLEENNPSEGALKLLTDFLQLLIDIIEKHQYRLRKLKEFDSYPPF